MTLTQSNHCFLQELKYQLPVHLQVFDSLHADVGVHHQPIYSALGTPIPVHKELTCLVQK